mgnify:CR=1 FL=1
MNKPVELKSCPFCQATPYKRSDKYDWDDSREFEHPENDCILEGIVFVSAADWNTRKEPTDE